MDIPALVCNMKAALYCFSPPWNCQHLSSVGFYTGDWQPQPLTQRPPLVWHYVQYNLNFLLLFGNIQIIAPQSPPSADEFWLPWTYIHYVASNGQTKYTWRRTDCCFHTQNPWKVNGWADKGLPLSVRRRVMMPFFLFLFSSLGQGQRDVTGYCGRWIRL